MQLFHCPFNDHILSSVEGAALKLSLLKAIPPLPPAQSALALHLPEEINELSINRIIDHVIDLASGFVKLPMFVSPPREAIAHTIVPILARKAGIDFSKLCLSPRGGCTCAPIAPPGAWSQTSAAPQTSPMMVMATMTPVTTLSTSYGGPGAAGPAPMAYPPLPEPMRQGQITPLMPQPTGIATTAFQMPQTSQG